MLRFMQMLNSQKPFGPVSRTSLLISHPTYGHCYLPFLLGIDLVPALTCSYFIDMPPPLWTHALQAHTVELLAFDIHYCYNRQGWQVSSVSTLLGHVYSQRLESTAKKHTPPTPNTEERQCSCPEGPLIPFSSALGDRAGEQPWGMP